MQKGHVGKKFATLHKFGSRKRKFKRRSVASKPETTPAKSTAAEPQFLRPNKTMKMYNLSLQRIKTLRFLAQKWKYESDSDSDEAEEARNTDVEPTYPHQQLEQVIQDDTNLIVNMKCLQSLVGHCFVTRLQEKGKLQFYFFRA